MDREKIVRELVNTFKDSDELHIAYKNKMKGILAYAVGEFYMFMVENERSIKQIEEWVDNFVEERFKPSDN